MTLFRLHFTLSNPRPNFSNIQCLKPNIHKSTTIPARDRIIEFGKHKGKMLGTLPSIYLKWVSKNLRARDFEDWAKMADQVLEDPVYKDRLEWEFADKVLNGDVSSESPVQDLLEISQRFGWDNEDKMGWKKVDFELLGTSKGGRIPRVGCGERKLRLIREKVGEGSGRSCNNDEKLGQLGKGKEGGGGERREERRERLRLKRGLGIEKDKVDIGTIDRGKFGNWSNQEDKEDPTVEIYNPFPGREALLKKVLNRKRAM